MAPRPVFFLAFANDRQDDRAFLRNLPEEKRRLRALLEGRKGQVEVVVRDNATLEEIFEVFQAAEYRDRIAVFHFAGHASSGALYLESREGAGTEAHGGGLAAFLGRQRGLELVVLNGCSSAEHGPRLLAAGVGAVVATSTAIDDAVATRFAEGFYRGLVGGGSVQRAFDEAVASERATIGDDPGRALRSLVPQAQRGEARWPWHLTVGEGGGSADRVLLPAPRPAAAGAKARLVPLLPYACDRHAQEGKLRADMSTYLSQDDGRPILVLVHGDERDAPTEFVQRVGVLTLPSLLGLAEGATIETPRRVVFKDAGRGAVGPRVEALLGQIGESLCGRARVTVAELADEAARLRAPILQELVWELGPQQAADPGVLLALLDCLAAWPRLAKGRVLIFALVISYQATEAKGLGGWLRGLVSKGAAEKAEELVEALAAGCPEGLGVVALPPLETIGVGDVMTWIQEYGAHTVGDAASRLLLEERLRASLEALFDPRSARLRMRELVPALRQRYQSCLEQEGL